MIDEETGLARKILAEIQVEEISFYHIHPLSGDPNHPPECPSFGDFGSTLHEAVKIADDLPNQAKMNFKVVTPEGRVTLQPNTRLIKNHPTEKREALITKVFWDFFDKDWDLKLICSKPDEFISQLSGPYMAVSYDRFEK